MRPHIGMSRLYTFVSDTDTEDLAGIALLAGWVIIGIMTVAAVFWLDPSVSGDTDLIRRFYAELVPSFPEIAFRY